MTLLLAFWKRVVAVSYHSFQYDIEKYNWWSWLATVLWSLDLH